ncbi:hypothetical protein CUC08_Gglean002354 [Alternaria sp. MG1]|nr:hypothetical protein CUC08_Gglean002354 [Alternaria sp. MG1]
MIRNLRDARVVILRARKASRSPLIAAAAAAGSTAPANPKPVSAPYAEEPPGLRGQPDVIIQPGRLPNKRGPTPTFSYVAPTLTHITKQ